MFEIKTPNEIISQMLKKIISETSISNIRPGSVISTLVETVAENDFQIYNSLLELSKMFNINTTEGIDLNKKAEEYNITRINSSRATGTITIKDPNFNKHTTKFYSGENPPVIGSTEILVQDASLFQSAGSIYIGRDSLNFEGPIPYLAIPYPSSISPSYWKLTLSIPLQKTHKLDETIIESQGGDRVINVNTVISTSQNNSQPAIKFQTESKVILLDGENIIQNVPIIALQTGKDSNISIRTINKFDNIPFAKAEVYNELPIINGKDLEADENLRTRIKNAIQTLSRGTKNSILNAIIGASSVVDNKTVVSCSLQESISSSLPAKLYIDDGTGFEPTINGKNEDILIENAYGTEKYFQLSQYPLTAPLINSNQIPPFKVFYGDELIIKADSNIETISFESDEFNISGALTLQEAIDIINSKSVLVTALTTNNHTQLYLITNKYTTQEVEILTILNSSANYGFKFSTTPVRGLTLYKNNLLLNKNFQLATIYSLDFSNGLFFNSQLEYYLNISVDNTPIQTITINNTVFPNFKTALANLWAEFLLANIAGINCVVEDYKLKISSNKTNSQSSSVKILYLNGSQDVCIPLFGGVQESTGKQSDYLLNKFNGQIELKVPLVKGESLTAGTKTSKSYLSSIQQYSSLINCLPSGLEIPTIIVSTGYTYCYPIVLNQDATTVYTITRLTADTVKIKAENINSSEVFSSITEGNFISIFDKGNLHPLYVIKGIHRIVEKINNKEIVINLATDVFTEVVLILTTITDIQSFSTDGILTALDVTSINSTVEFLCGYINQQTKYIKATVKNSKQLKLEVADYITGKISIISVFGNAKILFEIGNSEDIPLVHSAFIQSNKGDFTFPLISQITQDILGNNYYKFIFQKIETLDNGKIVVNEDINLSNTLLFLDGKNNRKISSISSIDNNIITLTNNNIDIIELQKDDLFEVGNCFYFGKNDKIVTVFDGDFQDNLLSLKFSRKGRITNGDVLQFKAYDIEGGIDFDSQFWNTSILGEKWFADSRILFKASNKYGWISDYIILRSKTFGKVGENTVFEIDYPQKANTDMFSSVNINLLNTFTVILPSGQSLNGFNYVNNKYTIKCINNVYSLKFIEGMSPNFLSHNVVLNDICTINYLSLNPLNTQIYGRIISVDEISFSVKLKSYGNFNTETSITSLVYVDSTTCDIFGDFSDVNLLINNWIIFSECDYSINNVSMKITQKTDTYIRVLHQNYVDGEKNCTIKRFNGYIQIVFPSAHSIEDNNLVTITFDDPLYSAWNLSQEVVTIINSTTIQYNTTSSDDVDLYLSLYYRAEKNEITGKIERLFIQNELETISIFPLLTVTIDDLNTFINTNPLLSKNLTSTLIGDGTSIVNLSSFDFISNISIKTNDNIMFLNGESFIKKFYSIINNTTYNFELKSPLINIFPLNSIPNDEGSVGEIFYITPTTTLNVMDWINFKNISTIATFSKASLSSQNNKIQIERLDIGSSKSLNIIGGEAIGLSNIVLSDCNALDNETAVFSINTNDIDSIGLEWIHIYNQYTSSKIKMKKNNVLSIKTFSNEEMYIYPHNKVISSTQFNTSSLEILDVSNIYGLTTGSIWRYHTAAIGSFSNVNVNDSLVINNSLINENNRKPKSTIPALEFSQNDFNFFTIINIDSLGYYIDVYNKHGEYQLLTDLGASHEFYIQPSFIIPFYFNYTQLTTKKLWNNNLICVEILGLDTNSSLKDYGVSNDSWIRIYGLSPNNNGIFKIISTFDNYILIENEFGTDDSGSYFGEEIFQCFHYNSSLEGDSISINDSIFNSVNQGTFLITEIGTRYFSTSIGSYIKIKHNSTYTELSRTLGNNNTVLINEKEPFSTYRKVINYNILDDISKSSVIITPNQFNDKISKNFGSLIKSTSKLNIEKENIVSGVDSYKYYSGLISLVHKIIDGSPNDPDFLGYKSSGTQISVEPPIIRNIKLGISIKAATGVVLVQLSEIIKSTIISYINSLKIGEDIIISKIIQTTQNIVGVVSVIVDSPANTERILVGDDQKIFINYNDISISTI